MPRLFWINDSLDRGEARSASWSGIATAASLQGRGVLSVVRDGRANVDVIAGDWNNQAFGRIVGDVVSAGFADPFAGADAPTLGGGLFAKRIDHILVKHHWSVASAQTLDVGGSDHRPLVIELGPHRGR